VKLSLHMLSASATSGVDTTPANAVLPYIAHQVVAIRQRTCSCCPTTLPYTHWYWVINILTISLNGPLTQHKVERARLQR
jgi:hypothetical protein